MEPLDIPEGYQPVMPYLIVHNAAAFISFMQDVFGATERYKVMRDEKKIMHAELDINGGVIMLADSTEKYTSQPAGMFIYVDDCDGRYEMALAAGAENFMEPTDQPYGRSAGVKDPFGNTWWITNA